MRRGPALVLGLGRRDLSELQPALRRAPDYVAVFGADHIYRMDPRQMVDQHIAAARR
jgi:glucose-1-phosphate adenylyltransferase